MFADYRPNSILFASVVLTIIAVTLAAPSTAQPLPEPATALDFPPRDPSKEQLGQLLFFDKILSGNRNISCASCHHPLAGTADALSLSVGEGGSGLGPARDTGQGSAAIHERVPRNAPHIFNLGARQFTRLFHDGRVEIDLSAPSGFRSPAGADLPAGLDNLLAVQAMFPVTSTTEMAGQLGENPIADAASAGDLAGPVGVWSLLAARLRAIPEYVELFVDAFDDIHEADQISFVHAANAIAIFEASAWKADNSPFDRYLRGDHGALSQQARLGMRLFFGRGGCSSCHQGVFQTDNDFHAIGVPQIGPGKGDNLFGFGDGLDDFGRERVTGDPADRFRFRTPTLRNVVWTGPWGHDGAFDDLEMMVRHHLRPLFSLEQYDRDQAVLPSRPDLDEIDFACHDDPDRRAAIADSVEIDLPALSDRELQQVLAFLHALTDPSSFDLRKDIPPRVPSGLPVND